VALGERERIMSLQIHEDENPQTKALAAKWQSLTPPQKINAALNMYREQPFVYTLRPPILGNNPVDDFLFNTKRGFCEHYATSFVYLMRAAGVPARIVTGYQGGELNPNGNYLIVRQSDAHAWAEVWLENQGWVRIDPTAAVSPERIELGIADALRDTGDLPFMVRPDFPLLKKAFLNWDSINNGWNQWVLGYDEKKQLDFLSKLTGKNLSLMDIAIGMVAAIIAAMAISFLLIMRNAKLKLSPVQRLYAQYLNKLKRSNILPYSHEGAVNFAERAAQFLPEQRDEILAIAHCYNQLQYSKAPDPQLLQQLKQNIQQFTMQKL
jgi:hypothetical protein